MGKRGPQPKGSVSTAWSPEFTYAIGLLVTDGCLYKDGRHICFVSKDLEQIENYNLCLGIHSKIGISKSGYKKTEAYRVQISDTLFHKFLVSIGVTPAKSKTIGVVDIPKKFFFDFLRGCFDGDGTFYSYWDPRWRSSHMFYLEFASASKNHINWLREEIEFFLGFSGVLVVKKNSGVYRLKYAKSNALVIINKMYYNPHTVHLSRKYLKIKESLEIERKQQKEYKK